jgi:hypothetical protein
MSGISLSPQLFQDIQQAIVRQEPAAAQDTGLVIQYLGAVAGYMLGSQNMPTAQKQEFLTELNGFIEHVMQDTDQKHQQQRQSQAANAFGIWEPAKG